MTEVEIQQGDITRVRAEALITAINSGGMWFGGIDGAIQRCAGQMFHAQAASSRLSDGDTVLARATQQHQGAFNDVLFVVDDLQRPLSQIVEIALKAADRAGITGVTLPAMRTGVMAGAYEKTARETIAQIGLGVRSGKSATRPTDHLRGVQRPEQRASTTEHLRLTAKVGLRRPKRRRSPCSICPPFL